MSCETCKYTNEDGNGTHCRGCIHNAEDHYKPITNADRIRNMTDEELAEFLKNVNGSYAEPCMVGEEDCKWEDYPTHDKGCKDCFLEWLQAEVEEE